MPETSTNMYAKEKGKLLENHVADQIVAKGIDPRARRDGASGAGTREKGDIQTSMMILGQNAGIECKNHKNLSIKEWWNQTKKLESLGREPMLVYKIQGQGFEDTLVTMYLDTILDLIRASGSSKIEPQSKETPAYDRSTIYEIERLKTQLNKVLNLIKQTYE